jgi:hypothetical protein
LLEDLVHQTRSKTDGRLPAGIRLRVVRQSVPTRQESRTGLRDVREDVVVDRHAILAQYRRTSRDNLPTGASRKTRILRGRRANDRCRKYLGRVAARRADARETRRWILALEVRKLLKVVVVLAISGAERIRPRITSARCDEDENPRG